MSFSLHNNITQKALHGSFCRPFYDFLDIHLFWRNLKILTGDRSLKQEACWADTYSSIVLVSSASWRGRLARLICDAECSSCLDQVNLSSAFLFLWSVFPKLTGVFWFTLTRMAHHLGFPPGLGFDSCRLHCCQQSKKVRGCTLGPLKGRHINAGLYVLTIQSVATGSRDRNTLGSC